MKAKFYICRHCGNLIGMIHDSGVSLVCCGEKMEALVPNTVEASAEKHLPFVTIEDGAVFVRVGSAEHPMLPEHYISWVYVETDKGGHRRQFKTGEKPEAVFALGEEKPVAVYAYCNIHGLWMTEL